MPNKRSRENRDFSLFHTMTDEELEEFLRLDEQTTEGAESDLEEILYIMEVLAERNKNRFSAGKSAEEAFISFQKNYMPQEDPAERGPKPEVPARKPRQWIRRLTAAAAAIAVVVVCSVTASAFGFDIWGTIVKWTQETFHFVDVGQESSGQPARADNRDFYSLNDTLIKKGISASLVPNWFPDGYELADVRIDESPMRLSIIAIYQSGEQTIKIQIKEYLVGDPQQIEKSDSLVEIYESDGITYYIFADNTQLRTAWITNNFECYFSGQLGTEEIKMMIDSIAKE